MSKALNQLILLGFLCQSFSWDSWVVPLSHLALWLVCLSRPRKPVQVGPAGEATLLAAGSAAAYVVAVGLGQNSHFFIGNGVTLFQAGRLLRPMSLREKSFALLLATLQVAVGCTIILDFRFFLILSAAMILIPRAFFELEAERFASSAPGRRPNLNWRAYSAVIAGTILFFLIVPRAFIGSPLQAHGFGRRNEGTLADSVLDPSRSGLAQSGRLLLQIEGKNVGYLRSFALVEFDGRQWLPDRGAALHRLRTVPTNQLSGYESRRVRVKEIGFLGRVLPTDGPAVQLQGKFFRRPLQNAHGMIECEAIWNTPNNRYEFWIDPRPKPERLLPGQIRRFTSYPPQSDRLRAWLEERLTGINDSLAQARRLERYFQENFTYQLGSPELSRLNPVEDFIFNQQEGHCERFAAALTLLLRMKNIPARIVVGYVPSQRNWLSGWYNVRFRDAHAWTEAYFPQTGWVQLDATPRASLPPSGSNLRDFFDAVDFTWYSYVVSFDGPAQRAMLSETAQWFGKLSLWVGSRGPLAPAILLVLLAGFAAARWNRFTRSKRIAARARFANRAADYYGQMLGTLAKQGFHRRDYETPLEFLRQLESFSGIAEVQLITEVFCRVRYGNHPLPTAQETKIEQALARLKALRATRPCLAPATR